MSVAGEGHSTAALVDRLHKESFGRLVATLTRVTGDLALAEDVVQEAFIRALSLWEQNGVPEQPVAWLSRTARNAAIDTFRKGQLHTERLPELQHMTELEQEQTDAELMHPALRDDMLRLVFTCCHPALSMEARVALTLKIICGLSTEEIARAFITTETTMAQRLVRAKQKITLAGIPYKTPDTDELNERLDSVLAVIYLIFNESYLSAGPDAVRGDLAAQAIRLGRLLCTVLSPAVEPEALLALMLLQDSRAEARFAKDGSLILLKEQNRSLWDKQKIAEGSALIKRVFEVGGGCSSYALQAAVASLHADAQDQTETDWAQIAELYRYLGDIDPSPVVELNRAVAVAEVHGPEAGLQIVEQLSELKLMKRYYLFHTTRADLLRRLDRIADARTAYQAALELTDSNAEQDFIKMRLNELGAAAK